ncbi:Protein kinase [Alternaria alternata]|nr:Protein kinase [Alternaria alternata]
MVARLVVYSDLDFVGLVNGKVVDFVCPAVVPCGLCTTLDCVFDLDVDKSFWASTKAPSGCVVDIGDGVYA